MIRINQYRVRFVIDEDARFEECNGEARPLSAAEYQNNQYMACPKHVRGSKATDTQVNGVGYCGQCGAKYQPIPYAEYLQYYGNPEAHVYLGCVVEWQCPCCSHWEGGEGYDGHHGVSLWGIDTMIDSPEYLALRLDQWYTPADARALVGYLGVVAADLLEEAGWTEEEEEV